MHIRQQGEQRNNISIAQTVLFFVLTFSGLSSATASSLAVADIEAELTYSQSDPGIEFFFFDGFSIADQIENGNALANGFAADPEDLGNGIRVEASATATSSAIGSALGFRAAFGSFELINVTPDPVNVDFSLMYEWTLLGSADDPHLDLTLAEIALEVFMNDESFTLINEGYIAPFNFSEGSGNTSPGAFVTQVFSNVAIPSGTTLVELGVAAQAEASAAAIPEPSTLLLLGSGLLGFAIHQRKKIRDHTT